MNKFLIYIFILISSTISAQELNCTVSLNVDKIPNTNQQIFKTLQKSLTELVNNTKWGTINYASNEKIDCSFNFTINTYTSDEFTGNLQIQASRPIFNSIYNSPILNLNDKDIAFNYVEFQNLTFSSNSFESNLVSLIAFYSNIIIAVDADTFSLEGGSKILENAQSVVNIAQQGQAKGWSQSDGLQNRFALVTDLLSPAYKSFRKAMYEYHLQAFDKMSGDQKIAKENIKIALKTLQEINNTKPNAYLTRVFFDAKSDEIVSIFADGPKVSITDLIETLNSLSPTNAAKWNQISY